jgi:nucleoside-diphosphate-sugar epimerase
VTSNAPLRFLITGATGFIGKHLTTLLLQEGHQLVCLVRDPKKLEADIASRVEVLRGDLSLFQDASLVLPEVDVVVHLAAVIAGKNEAEYGAINFDAVKDLLDALRRQRWQPKRVLFASSLAAAGPNHHEAPHTEDDDVMPIDPYGQAKANAEELMRAQPFPTTSFRPPIVLGAGDPATLTLYKMAASRFAFLPSGPPQRLSFIAARDLARAILVMATDASDAHRTYYVTNEQPITNRTLLFAMAHALAPNTKRGLRVVPVPHVVLRGLMHAATTASSLTGFKNQLDRKQYEQMTAPSFVCTSARLTRDTGWVAETSLEAITREAVKGYRALGQL